MRGRIPPLVPSERAQKTARIRTHCFRIRRRENRPHNAVRPQESAEPAQGQSVPTLRTLSIGDFLGPPGRADLVPVLRIDPDALNKINTKENLREGIPMD